MPTPSKLKARFCPNAYYHIVNKSIDGLLLFPSAADYAVFMERFKKFNSDIFEVWSFCLLPNHTHYIIKTKAVQTVVDNLKKYTEADKTIAIKKFLLDTTNNIVFDEMVNRQMNSFLTSYANYYNNKYLRKGGLFQKPYKHIVIHDEAYLQQAIVYCNANAQKHNIKSNFKEYKYSSYNNILAKDEYHVASENVINFFGGIEKFKLIHNEQVDYFYKHNWPSSKLE